MLLPAAEGCLGLMDKTRIQRLRSSSAFRALVVEHEIARLVGQRVLGIALGYEDLNDHDELRYYPITGTSTLNRVERRLNPPAITRSTLIAQPSSACLSIRFLTLTSGRQRELCLILTKFS
jgi:hypothetical protein